MESVTVITEPLLHPDFLQFHHVVPILERLRGRYDITVAAPRLSPLVQKELEDRGMRAADGKAWFPPIRRSRDELPSFIGSWVRDSIWGWNRHDLERALRGVDGLRVSASMTTAIDLDVWQIQSRPLGQGLDALRRGVNGPLRVALSAAQPVVGRLDYRHVLEAGRRAKVRYSTTQHVADWFAAQGLPVEGILPIYYRPTISRTTPNPARDYILVYLGKETDTAAVRLMLDAGLPLRFFGSKSSGWVVKALRLERYPNARLMGHVTDEELSDLYSNARFTAFPFTEEPFGLIPLESMACGTPILTYDEQGPAETVLNGRTGWLVHTPEEFAQKAVRLWNEGFPSAWMAEECLARSQIYDLGTVSAGWASVIDAGLTRPDRPVRGPRRLPAGLPRPTAGLLGGPPRMNPRLSLAIAGGQAGSPGSLGQPMVPNVVSAGQPSGPSADREDLWRSGAYPVPQEPDELGSRRSRTSVLEAGPETSFGEGEPETMSPRNPTRVLTTTDGSLGTPP